MKNIYILIFIVMQAYAGTHDDNTTKEKSCYELLKEIRELESDRKVNKIESGALYFIGLIHTQGKENEERDLKIKLLRFKLNNCQ